MLQSFLWIHDKSLQVLRIVYAKVNRQKVAFEKFDIYSQAQDTSTPRNCQSLLVISVLMFKNGKSICSTPEISRLDLSLIDQHVTLYFCLVPWFTKVAKNGLLLASKYLHAFRVLNSLQCYECYAFCFCKMFLFLENYNLQMIYWCLKHLEKTNTQSSLLTTTHNIKSSPLNQSVTLSAKF